MYSAECEIDLPQNPNYEQEISVTMNRTFEAAQKLLYKYQNERIAVLNFASATNPGEGVVNGARAQEESLCRCSTLYPCLNQKYLWDNYYNIHKANYDFKYSDACIYTPDITVIKTDTNIPERMERDKWFNVDVITCAAPNLRQAPSIVTFEEQYDIHCKRAVKILSAAIKDGASVLVLGAFGCGAFCNDPKAVAKAYKDVLKNFYGYFKVVEFAIFCNESQSYNNLVFSNVFK